VPQERTLRAIERIPRGGRDVIDVLEFADLQCGAP